MNIAQLPVRAVVRALNVFDGSPFNNRLVCVRHGRAPRAALTTSTSSRATAALEAVAWPSAQARSNALTWPRSAKADSGGTEAERTRSVPHRAAQPFEQNNVMHEADSVKLANLAT